jgi:hypothetical protein
MGWGGIGSFRDVGGQVTAAVEHSDNPDPISLYLVENKPAIDKDLSEAGRQIISAPAAFGEPDQGFAAVDQLADPSDGGLLPSLGRIIHGLADIGLGFSEMR